MRVSMLTCGTRGDTQPMTVLGAELRRRGHYVRIGASPNTLDQPRRCGFEALPLGPDSQALRESEEGRRWLASGNVPSPGSSTPSRTRATPASVEGAREICAGADVLVAGILARTWTASVWSRPCAPALGPDVRARAAELGSRLRTSRGAAQRAADAVEVVAERGNFFPWI